MKAAREEDESPVFGPSPNEEKWWEYFEKSEVLDDIPIYDQLIYGSGRSSISDARLPVILAVFGSGGHAIDCDGSGYNDGTVSSNWVIRAAGDIDQDGTVDLVWQSSSGAVAYWLLNSDGTKKSSGKVIGSTVASKWTIRASGE